MMNRAEIVIDGCSPDVGESIQPEIETSISRAKLYQSGERLRLEIEAEDVSDLRAAINSWLRLIKMCVEVGEVLKNG
jgi:KEOPS complex subunit Pcc1